MTKAWPPAPHDPRQRELAMLAGGWEVRVFADRKFQYFVTRGFLHVQLFSTLRTSARLPTRARLLTIERAFVDDIVRATVRPAS